MGVRGAVGVVGRGVGRGVGRLRQVPRGQLSVGAAGIALVATIPFGGLRESQEAIHPAVTGHLDEVLHTGPFDITITGVSGVDALKSYNEAGYSSVEFGEDDDDPLTNVLLIKATVVNTSDLPVDRTFLKVVSSASGRAPTEKIVYVLGGGGPADGAYTGVMSVDDATDVATLNPGIEYHLALMWEIDEPIPAELSLGIARMSYDPVYYEPDVLEWQHPDPAYQLKVPVVDRSGAAQRPPGWEPAERGDD